MQKSQKLVKEFHEKFELVINEKPVVPSESVLKLRCKLLLEEVLEFIDASGFYIDINRKIIKHEFKEPNLIEMADALTDIQYVNDGAAISLGIDLESLAEEVHRSNMTKLWPVDQLVKIDKEKHLIKQVDSENNLWLVKDKDQKAIKSPTYSPADIKSVLTKQGAILK